MLLNNEKIYALKKNLDYDQKIMVLKMINLP